VVRVAAPALRHRLILSFEAEADGVEPDRLTASLVDQARKEVAV